MPIISSFGTLTYNKIFLGTLNYWYQERIPNNPGPNSQTITFNGYYNFDTNELVASGQYTITTGVSRPYISKQTNSNIALPTINYSNTVGNLALNQTNFIVNYNSNNSSYYGGYNVSESSIEKAVICKLNANGTVANVWIDPPPAVGANTFQDRKLSDFKFNANGTYTVVGKSNEQAVANTNNFFTYITNFTDGTKNFAKRLNTTNTNSTTLVNLNIDSNNNFYITSEKYLVKLDSNANSITYQKQFLNGASDVTISHSVIDSNENTYILGLQGTNSYIVCNDNTGNVVWQKTISYSGNGLSFRSMDIDKNEQQLILTSSAYVSGNPQSENQIFMSLYTANGNIRWQNNLSFTGTSYWSNSTPVIGDLGFDEYNFYAVGYKVLPGVGTPSSRSSWVIKLPKDGAIPGNGNYQIFNSNTYGTLNLTYSSSNYSLTNSSLTISNSSLTLSNALTTTTTTGNTTSATTIGTYLQANIT